jgi:two-component system CheB/CheR fusion protein
MIKKQKKGYVKDEVSVIQKDIELQSNNVQSSSDNEVSEELVVVGIGASAGGLEALRSMFPNLSLEANMAYVIAQHLDPTHQSMLVQLLARNTSMKVLEVKDGQKAEANTIYITPPDSNVSISGGILHLSKPSMAIGPKPSIDFFFTSLAEDKGEKAVGIILSGTGSDGSHGIRAVKAEGGITIVQDEATARYNGMPHAAIQTGNVDLILPPEKIGKELLSIVKYPHVMPLVSRYEKAPDNLQKILSILLERHSCDFSDYKPTTINRRIERRMAVHKLDNLEDYVHFLEHSASEVDILYKDILISVTGFFRDKEAFKALEPVLVKIVETKKNTENIRIWVPGCATGEEAYSLAILLAKILGKKISEYNIQIFGTDIDNDAIITARKAVYSHASVMDVDSNIIERYFIKEDSTYQVEKSIREMVVFARQNLVKDPPFSHLDLISCRNVLIYFNTRLQKRIIPIFQYSLNQGGYLFLGKSESISQFDALFIPVNKKWKIYVRKKYVTAPLINLGTACTPQKPYGYRKPSEEEKRFSVKDASNQLIAEAYGPSGVVIDDRLEIIHIKGNINPYFNFVPGDADLNIINMARDELRIDLRTHIHKSSREGIPVRSKKLKLVHNGKVRFVTLDIRPIPYKRELETFMLILFEEEIPEKETTSEDIAVTAEGVDPRIVELEQELAATKEHLQTTVQELETANEELQSMNEELQSANEELQSSNEELETSNEELQSTNEELTTVNEELQVKSSELASAYADLQNIQNRVGIALLVVDTNLKITRFSPPATKIFDVKVENIGHVVTTVGCHINLPNLYEHMMDAINKGRTFEEEIEAKNSIYWMQIYPYYSEDNKISGAILLFFDKTDIKEVELELRKLSRAVEQSPSTIMITDTKGDIEYVNPKFTQITGYTFEEVLGKNPHILKSDKTPQEEYKRLWDIITSGGEWHGEFINKKKNGELYWESVSISPIKDTKGKITHFLGVKEDITERKHAEEKVIELAKFPNENPNPVLRVTENGTLIYANNSSLPLLNIWHCQVGQLLPDLLCHHISVVLNSGLIKEIEVACEDRIFSLKFTPIAEANYVNIYGLDITERKRAEEELKRSQAQLFQSEKMNALGTMIAGVAHELINPLMGLINYIEYCMKGTYDDEKHAILESAERETNRCIAIVENLLTFSHMDEESEGEFQKDSLPAIIDQILRLVSYRIEKEHVHVIKHYTEDIPEIWMRVNSIQQVFLNIITNSLDALRESEKKEIHIDIQHKGTFIQVTITDTGPGIAPENLQKIFDPFFTTKSPGQGTGLGLSICQSIIKIHGGAITCKSKAGEEAMFEVLLPVEKRKRKNE